jgi:predicted Zn-dependent protease
MTRLQPIYRIETSTMTQKIRLAIIIPLVVGAFVAIGLTFRYCVVPQQAVWDEETPVHWAQDKIPLVVHSDVYEDALQHATALWNKQAGFDLFEYDKFQAKTPTIVVRQGTIEVGAKSEDWAAGAFVNAENTYGEIIVYVPLMIGTDLQVLHHELGHILGLAHDYAYTMLPLVKEEIGGRQKLVRAQDKDIEALQERYRQ